MTLKTNDDNFRRNNIGMPDSHADKFREIAQQQEVIIISRAPGVTCRELLEQGYDTKGFRIHGKSCDWGPMAGFVMRDPRLNKKGLTNEEFNREQHAEAIGDTNHAGWTASTTPLKLYTQRVRWLQRKGTIAVYPMPGNANVYTGGAHHHTGVHFTYILASELVQGQRVWGVYFDTETSPFRQEVGAASRSYYRPTVWDTLSTRYEAMLAMTNPQGHASWPCGDFRNAVTGDYDLFAIWPYHSAYEHGGMDRRVLSTAQAITHAKHIGAMEHLFTEWRRTGTGRWTSQATKVGNLTNRIYLICQLLNSAIGGAKSDSVPPGPFPKRNVCWHSDETARPGVNKMDEELIAFLPSGGEMGIENVGDFKTFVDWAVEVGFRVTLAEGHSRQLGPEYGHLVPKWATGDDGSPVQWRVKDFFNA